MIFTNNARICLLASLLVICLATGCARHTPQSKTALASSSQSAAKPMPSPPASPTPSPQITSFAITGLVSTLEDETQDLPDGKIAWVTYWKLCWDGYPGAQGYELETMTGEGVSRKLRRQTETCFRLEIAKGRNEKSKGLFNRELMLASISGQIAYRVRACLDGNQATTWSPLMEAGKAERSSSPTKKKASVNDR
jgi:hypothetical protein